MDESRNAVMQAEWARGVLAQPAAVYPNGRNAYVVGEVLEDELIEFQLFH